jgi:hypothetical protein
MADAHLFRKLGFQSFKGGRDTRHPQMDGLATLWEYFNSRNTDWSIVAGQYEPASTYWDNGAELYAQSRATNIRPWFLVQAENPWPGTASYAQILFGAGTGQSGLGTDFKGLTVLDYEHHYFVHYAPFGGWNSQTKLWNDGMLVQKSKLHFHNSASESYDQSNSEYFGTPTYMIINGDAYTINFVHYQNQSNYEEKSPIGCYIGAFNPVNIVDTIDFPIVFFPTHASIFGSTSVYYRFNWGNWNVEYGGQVYSFNYGLIREKQFSYIFCRNMHVMPSYADILDGNQTRLQDLSSFFEYPMGIWRSGPRSTGGPWNPCNEFWGTMKFVKTIGCRHERDVSTDANVGYVGFKKNNVNLDTSRITVAGLTYPLP